LTFGIFHFAPDLKQKVIGFAPDLRQKVIGFAPDLRQIIYLLMLLADRVQ